MLQSESKFPANLNRYLCGYVVVSSIQLSMYGKAGPCHSPRYIFLQKNTAKQTWLVSVSVGVFGVFCETKLRSSSSISC